MDTKKPMTSLESSKDPLIKLCAEEDTARKVSNGICIASKTHIYSKMRPRMPRAEGEKRVAAQ